MKVIANWKMHGFKDDYLHWYKNLSRTADENLFDDLGIAPPFTLLDECKIHQSKINSKSYVTVWGDGTPKREFMYVDDCAKIICKILFNKKYFRLINIGTG